MKFISPFSLHLPCLKLRRFTYRHLSVVLKPKLNNSYYFKNGSIPLTNITAGDLIDNAANAYGDHVAFISEDQGISKTYLDLKKDAEKLASGFIARGLQKGDRIALYSPNCYEWPLSQFAAAKAGLILVAINFASTSLELEHCLKKAGCKAVISYDKLKRQDYYEVFSEMIPNLKSCNPNKLKSDKLPSLESIIMLSDEEKVGTVRFKDVLNSGTMESEAILSKFEKFLHCDEPLNIQFTSGTTSAPKAVVLSHHKVINNAAAVFHRLGYGKEQDVNCCQVPLFHNFGSCAGIFGPIIKKSTCILPSSTFDTAESVKCIEKYKCSSITGTPTMFVDLLKKSKELHADISSIKRILISGSAPSEGLLKGLYSNLRNPIVHVGYGLTESGGITITGNDTDYKSISEGFMEPLEDVEIKLIDSENRLVPRNVNGEICCRGPRVFSGYWNDTIKTAEIMDKNSWLQTGDIGVMNKNGWLKIVGRVKDIVIRGGENIFVTEVENFLSSHPAILEVYICGVPDERLGEELCCWITLKPGKKLTELQIREYCEGKMSYFKIPRYILFVEGFPKTTSGKIKKFEMRKMSIEKLQLQLKY